VRDLNELQRLAEQGHDESQFLLGYHYSKGQNKDINIAKGWLERAAMANNPRAQYYLGELCAELGRADPRAAYNHMAYWWNKSSNHPYWETMEGMDGRAVSKRRLVWLHMHSGYESANADEALRLLSELANKYSSPRSAIELGIVYAAGSFMPLSQRLGNAPVQRDKENGFRLLERGLKIIENGSNDIDYGLYNTIGDIYLNRDVPDPRTTESIQWAMHYKGKALERVTGFNEGVALNIKNELAALDNELRRQAPPTPGHYVPPKPEPQNHEPVQVHAPAQAPPARNAELTEKFEKFHAYFDTLALEGKRDFITSLDQKLQANPNPDYQGFLLECIEKYRIANKEAQAPQQSGNLTMGQPEPQRQIGSTQERMAQDVTRAEFLNTPGAFAQVHESESYQPPARQEATLSPQPSGEYPDSYTQGTEDYSDYQNPNIGNYDSSSYTDRIHEFGKSAPFMFGSVLYTLGGLALPIILWIFTNHPRNILGYGMMAALTILPILPIVSLWMIFMASTSPRAPEKSITALSLFRVTFFVHLCVIMAGAVLLALRFGSDGQALFGLSIFDSPLDLVLILGGLAVVVLYVTFFYGSLFSMIKGIRDGIYSNMFDALSGVGPFSVINYIVGIFVILGAVVLIVLGVLPDALPISLPEVISYNAYNWFGESGNMALALLAFTLILSRAGSLVCTNVVNQFNNGLEEEE